MRISDAAAMSGVSHQTAHKRLVRPARRADDRQGLPPASYEDLGVVVECVMTDNGPAYRSGEFNALLEARGMGHKYTRPFSPWQNGKVERMNRTIAREWQHARVWESRGSGPPLCPPSSIATIGTVRTARAEACLRCHA